MEKNTVVEIPTDIKVWFIKESHAPLTHPTFKEWERRGQKLCYEVAYTDGYQEASEAMYRHLSPELEVLRKERDAYRDILEAVAYPIAYLRNEAEKAGCVLNGMAYEVIKSPSFYQDLAKPVLNQYPPSIVTDKTKNNGK